MTTPTIMPTGPQPIGTIRLVVSEPEEFFNANHDPKSGRFGAGKSTGPGGPTSLQEKLSTATNRRMLTGGHSGAGVELLTGPGGKAILKTKVPQRDVDAEYLTSKMAKVLGAPVPRVERLGKNAMIMDYVDGSLGGKFSRGDKARIITLIGKKDRERVVRLKGARELAMLDLATNNFDRHGANIIVRRNGKSVVGIDHTLTFQPQTPPVSSRAFENHWKPGFTKSDYDHARKQIAPLRPEFEKLGRGDWFNQTDQRLAKRGTRTTEAGSTGDISLVAVSKQFPFDPEIQSIEPGSTEHAPETVEPGSTEPLALDPIEHLNHGLGTPSSASISLVPRTTEAFFNPTHDPKSGRFGARKGSGDGSLAARAPLQGDQVSKEDMATARRAKLKKIAIGVGAVVVVTGLVVAGVKVNEHQVGGQFIRKGDQPGSYKVKAKNGSPIELVDHDGMSAGKRKTLLRHTKDISDLHPLPGGQGIKISARKSHDLSPNAEAFTSSGDPRTIFVNTTPFFNHKGRTADLAGRGEVGKSWFMPGYSGGEQSAFKHMIYHEYGHVVDNDAAILNQPKQDKRIFETFKKVARRQDNGKTVPRDDLSHYGATKPQEAFAETFAEFYTSGGKSTNRATRTYAEEFGWEVG